MAEDEVAPSVQLQQPDGERVPDAATVEVRRDAPSRLVLGLAAATLVGLSVLAVQAADEGAPTPLASTTTSSSRAWVTSTTVDRRPVVGGGRMEVSAGAPAARLDFEAPGPSTHSVSVDVILLTGHPTEIEVTLVTPDGLELEVGLRECVTDPDSLLRCVARYPSFPGAGGTWTVHLRLVGPGPVTVEMHVQLERAAVLAPPDAARGGLGGGRLPSRPSGA